MSIPSQCRLCGAGQSRQQVETSHVYKGRPEHAFYRCQACDVVYLFPEFSQEETDHFYADEFEDFMVGRAGLSEGWDEPERHIAANQHHVERRMKYLKPHLPKKGGRILELGCSSGFMLYPLVDAGLDCTGIEPSSQSREFVRSNGIDCFKSLDDLEASTGSGKGFDLIIHFFVIDFQAEPLAFLNDQIKFLNPGGKIVFEVPSVEDALLTVYDISAYERFLWSVEHSFYFTGLSLTYLLEQVGLDFEILRDQRYDLSNHMVWARDGKPGGMGAFTDIIGKYIEDQYRRALIKAEKSDTLIGKIDGALG